MATEWTISSADLLLPGVGDGREGKALRLRNGLRNAIATGALAPGTRLPSSRVLAGDLGVARGVVVAAYEQLVAEGFLVGRQGAGTTVADVPLTEPPTVTTVERSVPAHDLRPGFPDLGGFPRRSWSNAVRAVLAEVPDASFGYGDPTGPLPARQALASYLGRVRGVRTHAEHVVFAHGFTSALASVVAALVEAGLDPIGVEDPGGDEQRATIEATGGHIVPVPVDEEGIVVDALATSGARAVLVTPAHQYPLGVTLSPGRRAALAAWARDQAAVVIEDDYDAEFRYDRDPVGTVQGIAPDRTIYLGSVAKTLAPALRIGWMVPPPWFVPDVHRHRRVRESQLATLDHLAFARLLDSGAYDRHLRQMRLRYRERRDVVVAELASSGLAGRLLGIAAGLHTVVALEPGSDDVVVADAILRRSVLVRPLSQYAVTSERRGVVIGFGNATPSQLRHALSVIIDEVRAAAPDATP